MCQKFNTCKLSWVKMSIAWVVVPWPFYLFWWEDFIQRKKKGGKNKMKGDKRRRPKNIMVLYPIYNYNMCVRLCVRRRFRVLIDWRNRPGQSDSETRNRPGQSDSANKKSPTKNRLCFLPRRAWKPRGTGGQTGQGGAGGRAGSGRVQGAGGG